MTFPHSNSPVVYRRRYLTQRDTPGPPLQLILVVRRTGRFSFCQCIEYGFIATSIHQRLEHTGFLLEESLGCVKFNLEKWQWRESSGGETRIKITYYLATIKNHLLSIPISDREQ